MLGDKKKAVMAILGPDKRKTEEKEDPAGPGTLHALGQEFMECVDSKDVEGMLGCLKAIFQEFDSEPHSEGEHY